MPKLNASAPQFLVEDVRKAAEYYRDKLGFEIGPYFEEDGVAFFVHVMRDGLNIQLNYSPGKPARNTDAKPDATDAYFWVDDVEALHDEFAKAGATIVEKPTQRFYGILEIVVDDRDGYRLAFGEPVAS